VAYVIFDLHGSAAALCPSSSTSLSDAYRYDPWGQTVVATGSAVNPWRYRGLLDVSPNATPLYDIGAGASVSSRQWDPRFTWPRSRAAPAVGARSQVCRSRAR
jgi:hypothetical protein